MSDYVDREDVRLTFRAVAPIIPWDTLDYILSLIPSAQPELIEQAAYVRGFEQGRTQGMIDAQCGAKMQLSNEDATFK